jgi:hypothetical protein
MIGAEPLICFRTRDQLGDNEVAKEVGATFIVEFAGSSHIAQNIEDCESSDSL